MSNYQNFDNFELLDLIASGSFSNVYKVKEKKSGNIFAAKISNKKRDEDFIKFKREANFISKINHPSILKFIGIDKILFKSELHSVIITEFIPNGTLNDIFSLENQLQTDFFLSDTTKLIIIYGIASAMSFLHSKKIVHRDLKPSNVLVDDFLCPKISDFGLSKEITNKSDYFESKLIGTPLYLPPEAWLKYEYTEAGDVYAYSMILYEIITNERPFKNNEPSEIAAKVTEGHRPSIINVSQPFYKKLIKKCWSQKPSERPTFDQILIELRENTEFLSGNIDKEDYEDYIEYVEKCQESGIQIDKFIKRESKNLKRISLRKSEIESPNTNIESINKKPQNHFNLPELQNSNDINDIFQMGLILMSGRETPIDLKKASSFFKRAADLGHVESMTKYAWMLENGYGVESSQTLAFVYYKKAAERGNVDAIFHCAWMLLNGEGTKKNEVESAHFFKEAADKGHSKSMYNFALMLQKGIGVKTDFNLSLHYYKLAVEKGELDAMNNYALILESGVYFPADKEAAMNLYKMAAFKGHAKAIYNLACMFFNVSKSGKAALLFKKAAQKGHVESMFILASLLLNGDGVRKNRQQALFYFKMAADRGHIESMHNYALMMKKCSNFAEALKYFKMAADKGNDESMFNFALMVENGEGIQKDKKVASYYYKLAAEKGNEKALEAYNVLNNSGYCLIN